MKIRLYLDITHVNVVNAFKAIKQKVTKASYKIDGIYSEFRWVEFIHCIRPKMKNGSLIDFLTCNILVICES